MVGVEAWLELQVGVVTLEQLAAVVVSLGVVVQLGPESIVELVVAVM